MGIPGQLLLLYLGCLWYLSLEYGKALPYTSYPPIRVRRFIRQFISRVRARVRARVRVREG